MALELHAGGALAVEQDAVNMRARHHLEVAARTDGLEVGRRRSAAFAVA
jgi:hypothetical protein